MDIGFSEQCICTETCNKTATGNPPSPIHYDLGSGEIWQMKKDLYITVSLTSFLSPWSLALNGSKMDLSGLAFLLQSYNHYFQNIYECAD